MRYAGKGDKDELVVATVEDAEGYGVGVQLVRERVTLTATEACEMALALLAGATAVEDLQKPAGITQ